MSDLNQEHPLAEAQEPTDGTPASEATPMPETPEAPAAREESALDRLRHAASDALHGVQEAVSEVAERAIDTVSDLVKGEESRAATAAALSEATSSEVEATADTVEQKVDEAADAVSEAAAPVAEAIEQKVDEAAEAVSEAAAPVAQAIEQKVDDTAEAVSEAAEAAPDAAALAVAAAEGEEDAEGSEGGEGEGKRRRRKRGGKRERRKLDSYNAGDEIEGTVRSIQPYGAFIDVGAERDGLVHISELRDGYVEKVEDVVKEGDRVTVRVKEVDTSKGRLSLSMRSAEAVAEAQRQDEARAQKLRLRDLSDGQEILGTVTSIVEFGAFVDIGATTDGLVHISEMSEDRVNRVEDVVSVGQEVKVRVMSVDRRRNRVSLSMKEQSTPADYTYEDDSAGEELPSAMEVAFARARERNKRDRQRDEKKERRDSEVDDIIRRTLAQHTDD